MTKNFKIKEKEKIKRLVRKRNLSLYRIRISLGECTEEDVVANMDFLLKQWSRISANRLGVFFKFFLGLIRELIVDIKGDVCEPYLQLLCFADKNKHQKEISELKSFVFIAWIRLNKMDSVPNAIKTERIPDEEIDKAIDELLLPWIRVVEHNSKLEELLDTYQYNRQLCSRSGIVSRKNMELQMGMER